MVPVIQALLINERILLSRQHRLPLSLGSPTTVDDTVHLQLTYSHTHMHMHVNLFYMRSTSIVISTHQHNIRFKQLHSTFSTSTNIFGHRA